MMHRVIVGRRVAASPEFRKGEPHGGKVQCVERSRGQRKRLERTGQNTGQEREQMHALEHLELQQSAQYERLRPECIGWRPACAAAAAPWAKPWLEPEGPA